MKLVIIAFMMTLVATVDCSGFDQLLAKVKESTHDNMETQEGILTPEDSEALEIPSLGL